MRSSSWVVRLAMPSPPLCAPAKYRAVIFNFMGDLANCFLHTYCFRLHLSSFLSSEVLDRFIYDFKGSDCNKTEKPFRLIGCNNLTEVAQWLVNRDPTRDGWIKEFIKRKWSSGLFWAVGAAEKKNLPTAISMQLFEVFQEFFSGWGVEKESKILVCPRDFFSQFANWKINHGEYSLKKFGIKGLWIKWNCPINSLSEALLRHSPLQFYRVSKRQYSQVSIKRAG